MKQMPSMEQAGLTNKILFSVENIALGRKNLAVDGREHEGRLFYEDGLSTALVAFMEAQGSADPQTMILAEEVFVEQEPQFCSEQDTYTLQTPRAAPNLRKTTEDTANGGVSQRFLFVLRFYSHYSPCNSVYSW